jgi:predicted urease superfamily metal-dependent hydrolase
MSEERKELVKALDVAQKMSKYREWSQKWFSHLDERVEALRKELEIELYDSIDLHPAEPEEVKEIKRTLEIEYSNGAKDVIETESALEKLPLIQEEGVQHIAFKIIEPHKYEATFCKGCFDIRLVHVSEKDVTLRITRRKNFKQCLNHGSR